jgi:hypothetical protein
VREVMERQELIVGLDTLIGLTPPPSAE